MKRASTRDRLDRLGPLASRLKAEEPMTVAEIASEFGISARTLARDLEILRERGLPVESDRGRGGGIRLHRTWGIGRVTLTYREAVDLLVSLAIAEQLQSPWLIANLSSVRRKLTASFAPALRGRIEALRNRILIGRSASAPVWRVSLFRTATASMRSSVPSSKRASCASATRTCRVEGRPDRSSLNSCC